MKTLRNPWFIAFCLIWFALFLARKKGFPVPGLAGEYLTDLLAVPVVAQLGLWFQRLMYKDEHYRLSAGHIIFIVIYISLVFELILPHFSHRYTADFADVFCYVIGGVFFWKVMNR